MEKPSLFRKEAITALRKSDFSPPLLTALPSTRVVSISALIFVVAILFLLFVGKISRKEVAYGLIESTGGIAEIRATRSGVIQSIFVNEGDRVAAGQPLVLIDASTRNVSGTNIAREKLRLVEEDAKRLYELSSQLLPRQEAETRILETRLSNLAEQRKSAALLLQTLATEKSLYERRLAALRAIANEDMIPKQNLWQVEQDLFSVSQKVEQTRLQLLELESRSASIEFEIKQLPVSFDRERDSILRARNDLQRRSLEISETMEVLITAPHSGIITAIATASSGTVEAGRRLLSIVPEEAKLRVMLRIPSNAIAFIRQGTVVRIRLDAFPYQRFGSLGASISDVSLVAPDAGIHASASTDFIAHAELDQDVVDAYGQQYPLKSGMSLQADLIVERQSVIRWLFDPLFAAGDRL